MVRGEFDGHEHMYVLMGGRRHRRSRSFDDDELGIHMLIMELGNTEMIISHADTRRENQDLA